ncbi:MAG TPA: hypothetical protein VMF11_04605 [Candidatus Baltobacteraceae bacterium]|nr:hypothetical protein [Candidatus Baltobacteraceae bacterium]
MLIETPIVLIETPIVPGQVLVDAIEAHFDSGSKVEQGIQDVAGRRLVIHA